jgi:hypothetical protein
MATTTPNFGWAVPTSTDLVKDGAVAIETLGDSIDASLVDLKGGTTGQVLAKASGTDMDFSWVAQDDSNAIQNAIVDAKGDLIAASANDTPARLAVGANGETLVADSSTATGLDWKSAAEQYPWQTYTPSYTRLTIGNGTVVARYQQIGKTVNMFWRLVWGSTTSLTNFPVVGLPVTGAYTNDYAAGRVTFTDATGFLYVGTALVNSGTGIYTALENTSGNNNYTASPDGTTPITWTTGDTWTITATYEAA